MKPQGIKKNEIVTRDMLNERINSLIGEEGLNIGNDEYYYIKTVGNHLVVGRAKIILED
ncbi:MAG: hypothetical protein NTY91_07370 [Euryarchaeota archaeon]|nr:hypothetical protein [Euryarchaeota archaeon]